MSFSWDPERYLTFADHRGRPFVELVGRVEAAAPATVVDLGCGPGNLTELLTRRWPQAEVLGLDSSPEMIERARADHAGVAGLGFEVADLRAWEPAGRTRPVDVLLSNATLQWIPDHLELLPHLVAQVAPGGWFAFQVPGNFEEPSHTLRRELAAQEPYAAHLADIAHPASHDPADYLEALASIGCTVDVWETTYTHLLTGPDPVFTWVFGTSLRPTLAALPDDLRERFVAELKARLAAAYPERPWGVALPFRRIFAVAQVPGVPV